MMLAASIVVASLAAVLGWRLAVDVLREMVVGAALGLAVVGGAGLWAANAVPQLLLLVPAAGHYPMAEYPELVGPAVAAFAARVTSRA